MKIVVQGLWHLGCVTAACSAKHFEVSGLDFDAATVAKLNEGQAPLFEPGLNELIAAGIAAKRLSFTADAKAAARAPACSGCVTTRRWTTTTSPTRNSCWAGCGAHWRICRKGRWC